MISTQSLSMLPKPDVLHRVMQTMALLDAIIEADWQYRYYSFNARWSPTEQMGSMRNGEGDDLFAVFDANGCFIKGFAHEAPMSPYRVAPPALWPGILEHVPATFAASLAEPAFKMTDTTFCLWHQASDTSWQVGPVSFPSAPDPDGSAEILSPLDGLPDSYIAWAEEYYEVSLPLSAVRHVYEHRPLSPSLLADLRCSRGLSEILLEATDIGYPAEAAV